MRAHSPEQVAAAVLGHETRDSIRPEAEVSYRADQF
jgi:hypothetical protein